MRHILIIISLGMVISFIVVACSFTSRTPDASATLRAVYTSQAGTVQVLETRAGPLPTSIAGITPSAPNVLPATISTPAAPITQPALQTDGSCNKAEFVQDVSIPDGSKFSPGEVFTKTWRLKNIGTCSWNKGYALVFSTGNVMNGASSTALPVIVNPGDTVDISVGLTAPSSAGAYRGYWLLRSDSGSTFGLGSAASVPFFVDIVVVASVGTSLDFTADYCGSIKKAQVGHVIISVAKTLQQKEMKLATIAITKSRIGDDGIVFENCKFDNGMLEIDTESSVTFLGLEEKQEEKNRERIKDLMEKRKQKEQPK